jgi:hypothetical protein
LQGVGPEAVEEVTKTELWLSKGSVLVGNEQGRHLLEDRFQSWAKTLDQLLGLELLLGREGWLHRVCSETGWGFLGELPFFPLVYKDSTNFRDAHTIPS